MIADSMDGVSNGEQCWNIVAVQNSQAELEGLAVVCMSMRHELDEQIVIKKSFKPRFLLGYGHMCFRVSVLLDTR